MSFVGRNNAKITNRPSGGGSKLQGLTSTTDKRSSSIRAIQNRSWGENRNLIFCMNQLGGVGRHKSQFHTPADGLNCKEEQDYTLLYISQIQNFFKNEISKIIMNSSPDIKASNHIQDFQLSFVGNKESFWNDVSKCNTNDDTSCTLKNIILNDNPSLKDKIFTHLLGNSSTSIYLIDGINNKTTKATIDIPANILEKIKYVNANLPNFLTNKNNPLGTHTLAILNNNFNISNSNPSMLLKDDNYGIPIFGLIAYTNNWCMTYCYLPVNVCLQNQSGKFMCLLPDSKQCLADQIQIHPGYKIALLGSAVALRGGRGMGCPCPPRTDEVSSRNPC